MRDLHNEICDQVDRGNATPFLAFRQAEYWATRNAISRAPTAANADERMYAGIVMTGEVWRAARALQDRGCVVFGLSDKPDEACFPPNAPSGEGELPLHRVPMPIVGSGR
nr:hypothetical protein [Candidatus Bipolaricaulota bacterium]